MARHCRCRAEGRRRTPPLLPILARRTSSTRAARACSACSRAPTGSATATLKVAAPPPGAAARLGGAARAWPRAGAPPARACARGLRLRDDVHGDVAPSDGKPLDVRRHPGRLRIDRRVRPRGGDARAIKVHIQNEWPDQAWHMPSGSGRSRRSRSRTSTSRPGRPRDARGGVRGRGAAAGSSATGSATPGLSSDQRCVPERRRTRARCRGRRCGRGPGRDLPRLRRPQGRLRRADGEPEHG